MISNGDMTVYNKHYDYDKDIDIYQRTVVRDIFWSSQEGYIKSSTNNTSDDKAKIFIPKSHISIGKYVNSDIFDNLKDKTGHYTFRSGDLVVKGEFTKDISLARELGEYYTITTVDLKDFGSEHMRHWVVMAK